MMATFRMTETFEAVLDEILTSWTALDLAIGHYDGSIRDAKEKRTILLESLSDAIRQEKYEMGEIAEFINEYMYDSFFMELDDNSPFDIARVCMEAWAVCKQGRVPQIPGRKNGANCSIVQNLTEEVDESASDIDDTEMADDPNPQSRPPQPRTITDEDGWTTVVPKQL